MTDFDRLRTALADRYALERDLGAGGMATVYLAEDLRHHRRVAIKVLRPELAAVIGAQRFLSEIQTTANLQHPHILPLLDSGEVILGPGVGAADSEAPGATSVLVYYVMPYVEGDSLHDRLVREKQLPIPEAIRIATEIAGALDYAHRHGVIHRDIKPANILLHDGNALVADFGIALAASQAGSRMTETGMSLGTPEYMSPEQAMGERDLDARSDVYALGCVLYEMLTGEAPFTGPTAQAIVAKVMTTLPTPPEQLRNTIGPALNDAVMTALQKLPADRFRSAAEFSASLAAAPTGARSTSARVVAGRRRGSPGIWAAAVLLASVAGFLLGSRVLASHDGVPMVLGRATHLTWDLGLEVMPALSPDGKSVAYAVNASMTPHIMVRDVNGGRAFPLTGDSTGEWAPVWMPDGSRILYLARGGVFSAQAGGGPGRPEIPGAPGREIVSVTPSPDGQELAFSRGDSLLIRSADGTVRGLATMLQPIFCTWSPDGRFIACATGNGLYGTPGINFGNQSPGWITICRVSDGRLTVATDSLSLNTSPTWSADGRHLIYLSNQDGEPDIYAVAIGGDGRTRGAPIRLSAGLGAYSISSSRVGSSLAYARYTASSSIWEMPAPTAPGATSVAAHLVRRADEVIENIAVTPDYRWLYFDSNLPGNAEVFRLPLPGGELERLTNNPADDFAPDPSPDGKSFVFHSWRSGSRDVYVKQLDGSGITAVTSTPAQEAIPKWSPDGTALAFSELSGDGGIWIARRDASGKWGRPVRRLSFGSNPSWSPDGKRLVFVSSLGLGSVDVMAVDSGPVDTLVDETRPGNSKAGLVGWKDADTVLFGALDAGGAQTFYQIPAAGGTPTVFLRLDPTMHPSFRGIMTLVGKRCFFVTDDRQADLWVVQLKRMP